MRKALIIILALLFGACNVAQAMELVRQKNVATYITFPLVDVNGDVVSSTGNPDSEIDAFADGSAPDGFADCTNEATEDGSTGIYYLSLTQSEMNNDYIYIQVKSDDAKTQHILIRTVVGDPLNVATTDDGGTINVTSGKIDEVSALTGNTAQTGDSYARLGGPAGASVSADIAAIKSDTGAILTDTAAMDTSSELRTLLYGSDTAGAIAANQITIIGYIDTEVADILTDTGTTIPGTLSDMAGATFNTSTDSLEALRNRGDVAWITATGFSTHSAADVWAVGTRTLTSFSFDAGLTAAAIDAIWNELQSGHTTAGSFGEYLDSAVSGVTAPSAASVADAVWEEQISDHSGTSGSTAESLNSASSAGDPWNTDISTGYTGKAGETLRNININTRMIR